MIVTEHLEEGLVEYSLLAKDAYSLEFLLLHMSTVNTCQEHYGTHDRRLQSKLQLVCSSTPMFNVIGLPAVAVGVSYLSVNASLTLNVMYTCRH